jgi:hypothetical protein
MSAGKQQYFKEYFILRSDHHISIYQMLPEGFLKRIHGQNYINATSEISFKEKKLSINAHD